MAAVQFQCPTCQSPLRLENRAMFVGRTFACPDCAAMLLIEPRGHDGVSARVTVPDKTETRRSLKPPSPGKSQSTAKKNVATLPVATPPSFGIHLPPQNNVLDTLSRRPALLGWSVAALFAIVLFAVIHSGGDSPASKIVQIVDDQSNEASQTKNSNDRRISQKQERTDSNLEPSEQPDQTKSSNDVVANKTIERIELVEPDAALPPVKPDEKSKQADSAVPKPGDNPTLSEIKADRPRPDANNLPVEPVIEPAPKAPPKTSEETINARLNQKVARFDQSKPVPFIKLLDVLEDLAGVPIVWDLETVDDKQLQKSVSLKQQQTTVGEIFDAVLKQVGLERRIGNGQIELVPTKIEETPKLN